MSVEQSVNIKNTDQALAPLANSRVGPVAINGTALTFADMGLTVESQKSMVEGILINVDGTFNYRFDGVAATTSDIELEAGSYLLSRSEAKLASFINNSGAVNAIIYPVGYER